MRVHYSLLLTLSLSFCMRGTAAETQITIAGSTTVHPVIDLAQKAFSAAHPEVTFALGQGGSSAGIEKAGKGDVFIGMTSREIKAEEKTQFPDLISTVIGTDGLALIVNSENTVSGLTKAQVADIYGGKITDWKDVGGKGPIVLISEQEKGGTLDAFKHHFGMDVQLEGEGADKGLVFRAKGTTEWSKVRAKRTAGTKEIMATVLADPGAIGFVSVAAAEVLVKKGGAVKLLAIDGKTASSEQMKMGTYTLTRPLILVCKNNAPSEVTSFIAYVLSPAGQALVAKADFLPVK